MEEFLDKYIKNILFLLAEEFETNASASDEKKSLIQVIFAVAYYDEDLVKSNLECILKEDEERKK